MPPATGSVERRIRRTSPGRLLKRSSVKATASEGQGVPSGVLGYGDGLNDARTLLADFFSILRVLLTVIGPPCQSTRTDPPMSRLICLVFLAFVGAELIGACSPRQFTTVTIYENPTAYVRLEFDRTVKKGAEHSHPISLTTEQIASVLGGVRIEEPIALVRGDILQRDPVQPIHPAFSDKDIESSLASPWHPRPVGLAR